MAATRTETQSDPATNTVKEAPRRNRFPALVVIALLIVGAGGFQAWQSTKKVDVREGTTLVDANGLAARHGINITLMGITGSGGLIDFRYQVVDPDKANPIIHDDTLLPRLINQETGATIGITTLPHSHDTELVLGGTYFFLFANASGAFEEGSLVTVVIGDVRIENLIAQA